MELPGFFDRTAVRKFLLLACVGGFTSAAIQIAGCDAADPVVKSELDEESGWLIPVEEVISAQGLDGIPSIDDPVYRPAGESIDNVLHLIETTWKSWKQMYPDSKVLTTETGFQRSYEGFGYGSDYLTDHDFLLFPVRNRDDRLEAKDRVLGVFIIQVFDSGNTLTRVYPIEAFGDGVNLIEETVQEKHLLVVGSSDLNFTAAFHDPRAGGSAPEFQPVQSELPVILEDSKGNRWDLFGYAVEGPLQGERLETIDSYTGYWFAWADMFPNVQIYIGN